MVNMIFKKYSSYSDYVKEQRKKRGTLGPDWIMSYEAMYQRELKERLLPFLDLKGASVLCLGARAGAEVRAFIDHGSFAVGIDLEPGNENRFVVTGDFHQIQYADASIDYVFTNSLDHSFDLKKVIGEVFRVLKFGGTFIVEAVKGTEEGVSAGAYESVVWKKAEELKEWFSDFELVSQVNFSKPWFGVQFSYKKPRDGNGLMGGIEI